MTEMGRQRSLPAQIPANPTIPLLSGPTVSWVPELQPAGDNVPTPASGAAQVSRAVQAVGQGPVLWAVEVGRDVADRVAIALPRHMENDSFDVLRMGTEAASLQALLALAGVEIEHAMTDEHIVQLRDFVSRRISVEELLRGIQLGHSVIAGALLAACAALGDKQSRDLQMRTISQQLFAFFDAFAREMSEAFAVEEVRWAKSENALRFMIADELLSGTTRPVADASARLRYDLSRGHVALIAWSLPGAAEAQQPDLATEIASLLRAAGCEQQLVLTVHLGMVWAWVTPRGSAAEFAAALRKQRLPSGVRIAVGSADRKLAGFRGSHFDAQAAHVLAAGRHDGPAVTFYREVDLLSLLLCDRDRAVRFACRELRGLAAGDASCADLRRTLAVYLDTGGSPQSAAAQLNVSRNTVTYRVNRATELLGRSPDVRRLQLQTALAIIEECGAPARD